MFEIVKSRAEGTRLKSRNRRKLMAIATSTLVKAKGARSTVVFDPMVSTNTMSTLMGTSAATARIAVCLR